MIDLREIKGIIFDYGGTIDSNGEHWFEVLWKAFASLNLPVSKEVYKEAYIFGERALAVNPLIEPGHTFRDVLQIKFAQQFSWLIDQEYLVSGEKYQSQLLLISEKCYSFAEQFTGRAAPVLRQLHEHYPLVLVSNFYGNVSSVLKDFSLIDCFDSIVESSVVGIRKPDPAIFSLGVGRLGLKPKEVVVVGDSYSKDIYPASQIGCKTIWIKGAGWDEKSDAAVANAVIEDFEELRDLFNVQ